MLPKKLRSYRRLYAGFFFALFIGLLFVTDYSRMQGYPTKLLLELDPLTAIAAFLTSGTFYLGLLLALLIIIPTLFMGRFFCSWICPLGIANQFLGWLFHGLRPSQRYELNRYRPIYRLKYYI
ncbi:MAG: 4Fe-4S binding protein, partial [Gammaproteobacteria bacterium]|nr:4Fe-4S binding protein [Gammaproteobacteria bacterium]